MKLNGIFSPHCPAFPFGHIDVNQSKTRVYGWKKYHELYGSGLIAALNYCFQNIGGTTHKA